MAEHAFSTLYSVGIAVFGFTAIAALLLGTLFARYSSHRIMIALYAFGVHITLLMAYVALRQDNGVVERAHDHVEIEISRYVAYLPAQFGITLMAADYFWQPLEPGWLAVLIQLGSYFVLLWAVLMSGGVRYLLWAISAALLAFNALSMYYGSRLRYQPTLAWRVVAGICLYAASAATPVWALLCRPFMDAIVSKFTQEMLFAVLDFVAYTCFSVYCYATHVYAAAAPTKQV